MEELHASYETMTDVFRDYMDSRGWKPNHIIKHFDISLQVAKNYYYKRTLVPSEHHMKKLIEGFDRLGTKLIISDIDNPPTRAFKQKNFVEIVEKESKKVSKRMQEAFETYGNLVVSEKHHKQIKKYLETKYNRKVYIRSIPDIPHCVILEVTPR